MGTGLGPTLEFYTLLAHELQRKSLGMWRSEGGGGGSAGAGPEKPEDVAHIRVDRQSLPMQVRRGKSTDLIVIGSPCRTQKPLALCMCFDNIAAHCRSEQLPYVCLATQDLPVALCSPLYLRVPNLLNGVPCVC